MTGIFLFCPYLIGHFGSNQQLERGDSTVSQAKPGQMKTPAGSMVYGKSVFDFDVKNGKRVVQSVPYSVLKSDTSWSEYSGWKKGSPKLYSIRLQNIFGQEVARVKLKVSYVYGGSIHGVGKYIAQVQVTPLEVRLNPFVSFKYQVAILGEMNYGTEENPIVGLNLLISADLSSSDGKTVYSEEMFIRGDVGIAGP